MRECDACNSPIRLMTPPVGITDRTKQFCGENCRKLFDQEIKPKEWERRRNANRKEAAAQD